MKPLVTQYQKQIKITIAEQVADRPGVVGKELAAQKGVQALGFPKRLNSGNEEHPRAKPHRGVHQANESEQPDHQPHVRQIMLMCQALIPFAR